MLRADPDLHVSWLVDDSVNAESTHVSIVAAVHTITCSAQLTCSSAVHDASYRRCNTLQFKQRLDDMTGLYVAGAWHRLSSVPASPGPASSSGGSAAGELHCDVIMVHVLHSAPLGTVHALQRCGSRWHMCSACLPGLDSDGKLPMLHVTLLASTQTLAIEACICVD